MRENAFSNSSSWKLVNVVLYLRCFLFCGYSLSISTSLWSDITFGLRLPIWVTPLDRLSWGERPSWGISSSFVSSEEMPMLGWWKECNRSMLRIVVTTKTHLEVSVMTSNEKHNYYRVMIVRNKYFFALRQLAELWNWIKSQFAIFPLIWNYNLHNYSLKKWTCRQA